VRGGGKEPTQVPGGGGFVGKKREKEKTLIYNRRRFAEGLKGRGRRTPDENRDHVPLLKGCTKSIVSSKGGGGIERG